MFVFLAGSLTLRHPGNSSPSSVSPCLPSRRFPLRRSRSEELTRTPVPCRGITVVGRVMDVFMNFHKREFLPKVCLFISLKRRIPPTVLVQNQKCWVQSCCCRRLTWHGLLPGMWAGGMFLHQGIISRFCVVTSGPHPSPWGGKYQLLSFGRKIMTMGKIKIKINY